MSEAIRISDLGAPRLPAAVRWGNRLAGPFVKWLVSLDAETLLDKARRKTGLSDFGAASFREPLSVLLRALESEADLSPLGRFSSQQLVLQLLCNRLRIEDLFARHPEIAEERIDRPLIIAGLPRTGTTHLHNLISRHPGLRSLPYYESLEPIPVEGEAPGKDGRDPRIVRCDRGLDFLHQVMPLFPAMHEMTWDAVHEEIQLLAIEFSTMLFESSYDIPSYRDWYMQADQRPAYRYLHRTLQALQWLRGPRRWVLKSPQHLEQLAPLMETFPDATVVQTHRDPLRITASLCTMIAYGSRMQAARVDPVAKGRYWASRVEDLLRGSIEGRVHLPEERVVDVHFQEFMTDDLAMAERVLQHSDVPVDEAARQAMRDYLEASPRGRHGRIAYVLEDLGLEEQERRAALRFYSDHFGVADE